MHTLVAIRRGWRTAGRPPACARGKHRERPGVKNDNPDFAIMTGTFNKSVRDAALMRMSQAGAVMINWFALACELARDWRNDMEGLASLLGGHLLKKGGSGKRGQEP
jgi:hypothetical protein